MKFLYLLLLGFLAIPAVYAQTEERCGNAEAPEEFMRLQSFLEKEISRQQAEGGRTKQDVYIIPLIFHVMHQNEPVGTGTNISLAQIQSQIDVLNEDFGRYNADRINTLDVFKSLGTDSGIRFVLATTDSAGRPLAEPGVRRFYHQQRQWTLEQFNAEIKPKTIWDPTRYFNVWSIGNLVGFYGYTQFPDFSGLAGLGETDGTQFTDGIIMDFDKIGSYTKIKIPELEKGPFNLGRTLTHELGHAFGLLHTWGASSIGDCNRDLDYCADTPIVLTSSSACELQRTSCGHLVMVQNYMDYSHDACMNIFTKDQITRMRTVLTISPRRKELIGRVTALPQEWINEKISVYPNPAQTSVRISGGNLELKSYRLISLLGQEMRRDTFQNNMHLIEIQGIPAGIYLLQIETNRGLAVKKLVISQP